MRENQVDQQTIDRNMTFQRNKLLNELKDELLRTIAGIGLCSVLKSSS